MPPAPPPRPTSPLARLADTAFRRRRIVLGTWLLALVAAIALGPAIAGEWDADYSTPGSDSQAASALLQDRFPDQSTNTVDIVWSSATGAATPAVTARVNGVLRRVQALPGVGDGVAAAQAQVSADGRTALVRVPLTVRPPNVPEASQEALLALGERGLGGGTQMAFGGQVIEEAQQGAISSEGIGLMIALLILLATFGSVVAAGLPMATAIFGLGVSAALIGGLAALIGVPDWAEQVAAMVGIGVGIDYALLILTRHRASIARGLSPHASTVEALTTAGRSVLIAGTTVVVSMLGLFLMGLPYLRGVALATSISVLVVMAATVTLLPALLGFAGLKINRLRVPFTGGGAASDGHVAARWSRMVQRRPWTALTAGVALLLVLMIPLTGLTLGFPDSGNDPEGTQSRQAYALMAKGFGPGAAGPLLVVAELPSGGDRTELTALAAKLRSERGVAAVSPPTFNRAGDTGMLAVQPTSSPQDQATKELVSELRDGPIARSSLAAHLGGFTAEGVDQSEITAQRLPLFILGVMGLSSLLLLVAFRSVLIPIKAAAMNLLSIGAAYGIVALVAEGGWAGQLVGIDTATPIPPFIPVMMFAILFGLSMDYEVFLVARIRESWLGGATAERAVTEGLAGTARVITAAAAIMIAVFGAFVLSDQVFLKLVGVGLASAILVDATVVRMVLVPAVMQLFGKASWWMPSWLERAVPRTQLEGSAA